MIFGHEGGVRAGKSYEAVLYHIVPALQAGRHVFARLNGIGLPETVAATAAYLGKEEAEIAGLIHPMGNAEVKEWLVCETANDGSMLFPHIPQGSLIVVDEAHEYWPVGRAALPEQTAEFFAKHGHASLDIVVLTQDVKELHRSIVRRMTKKNFYAKLDSLGEKFDSHYSVRFYSSPAPGKFELITSEKREYDPKIWKLYHGVQPGIETNAVYKGNTTNLWKAHRKKVFAMAAAVLLAVGLLVRFFTGGGEGIGIKEAKPKAKPVQVVQQVDMSRLDPQPIPGVPGVDKRKKAVEKPREPGEAYVLDLLQKSRPRYLGEIMGRQLVEFRATSDNNQVTERMTGDQLQALGWVVAKTGYGMSATLGESTIIFTAWPIDPPLQISQQTQSEIRAAGLPVMSGSESQPTIAATQAGAGTSSGYGTVAHYGGIGVGASPR